MSKMSKEEKEEFDILVELGVLQREVRKVDRHIHNNYKKKIYKLENRINKTIEILSEDFRNCPMSLTLEKSYIIEQDKIKKALNTLKGSEE